MLLPQKYVRKDEEGKITFSKKGLLAFIGEIKNENKTGKWIDIYNKEGLVIEYKNGVKYY